MIGVGIRGTAGRDVRGVWCFGLVRDGSEVRERRGRLGIRLWIVGGGREMLSVGLLEISGKLDEACERTVLSDGVCQELRTVQTCRTST